MRRALALAALVAVLVTAAALPGSPGSAPQPAHAQANLPFRVVLGHVARDGTNPTDQLAFVTSARASSATAQGVELTISVKSLKSRTVLVDVEVYDSAGRRINQQWFDNLKFTAGQSRDLDVAFVPSASSPAPFTVKVGIFEPGAYWGLLLHWNNAALTFSPQ